MRPVLVALLLAACHADPAGDADSDAAADSEVADTDVGDSDTAVGPDTSWPFGTPVGQWTWVDVPGMICADGTRTGVGVNLSDTSDDVLVVVNGGGLCWDEQTCVTLRTAVGGPFGATELAQLATNLGTGLFDRDDASNPFRDLSMVLVPNCTGDGLAGAAEATFGETTWRFAGRGDLQKALARVAAAFPDAQTTVLAGVSSGALGATLAWPTSLPGESVLLVDSFPLLVGDDVPADRRAAWSDAWGLDFAGCDGCDDDLSAWYTHLATVAPDDHVAVLTHLQDAVTAALVGTTGEGLEPAVDRLQPVLAAAEMLSWRAGGTGHTFLPSLSDQAIGATQLSDWLGRVVDGDPTVTSVRED